MSKLEKVKLPLPPQTGVSLPQVSPPGSTNDKAFMTCSDFNQLRAVLQPRKSQVVSSGFLFQSIYSGERSFCLKPGSPVTLLEDAQLRTEKTKEWFFGLILEPVELAVHSYGVVEQINVQENQIQIIVAINDRNLLPAGHKIVIPSLHTNYSVTFSPNGNKVLITCPIGVALPLSLRRGD